MNKKLLLLIPATLVIIAPLAYLGFKVTTLEKQLQVNQTLQDSAAKNLYNDHLSAIEIASLEGAKKQIEEQYQKLSSEADKSKLAKIDSVYKLYQDVTSKIKRNDDAGLKVTEISDQVKDWGVSFLNQDFDPLASRIESARKTLDSQYQSYLASIIKPSPTPAPAQSQPSLSSVEGYTYKTVSTSLGSFGVYLITMPLSQVTVKTVSANESDCTDNCPTKPLEQYVKENNAYAGLNGTYFCPPDYSTCVGKVNSYYFSLYNSNLGKWINEQALKSPGWGLASFNGGSVQFYRQSKDYTGSPVSSAISNFPPLLENGAIVVDENQITEYQKTGRGPKGFIGVDQEHIYLGIVSAVTVPEEARVVQALGIEQALNLDGGGSSALYIGGSYKVGPGRALPNVVLLIKH